MIVGRGLLAKSFQDAELDHTRTVVIAAGVSNSVNPTVAEMEREEDMIRSLLLEYPDSACVYFGTTSVYDPLKVDSTYVQHKLRMESLILKEAKNLVLRLPNVVGAFGNENTLFHFLRKNILENRSFEAWVNHKRFLVDVEWVPRITIKRLERGGGIENVRLNQGIKVGDLIRIFEVLHGKSAKFSINDRRDEFNIPVSDEMNQIFEELNLPIGWAYETDLIKKYF
jgi:nucleoside-diphosphate-sugar epimerase